MHLSFFFLLLLLLLPDLLRGSCQALIRKAFGLGDRLVRSQIVGEGRSRLPGRRTCGKVRRGGRYGINTSDRMEKKIHRFWRQKQAFRLPCLSLGFNDDRRGMSKGKDVSLTIFVASMSGSKSFTSRLWLLPFQQTVRIEVGV